MGAVFRDASFQAGLRGSLAVLLVVGGVWLAYLAWPVVQALLIAVVIATALWPWVSRLSSLPIGPRRWRLPRVVATGLIYLVTFATAGLMVWVVLAEGLPYVDRVLAAYPEQARVVREYVEPFRAGDIAGGAARVAGDVAQEAAGTADAAAGGPAAGAADEATATRNVGRLALGLFGGLATLALVLLFTFFLLLEGHRFAQWLVLALPRDARPQARAVGLRVRDRISAWVLAQAIYGTVSGLIVGGGMALLQVPSPWLYGVAGAILAVLPGIGPSVAAIPAFLVALDLAPWQPVAVAVFGLALYVVDSTTVSTRIYGHLLRLPMFVVLLSLFLGGALMGVWGALVAAPVAAAIQVVLRDLVQPDRAGDDR
jgi:predicted PurR-regulated permease PerM